MKTLKKFLQSEPVSYLFFGVLTTLVFLAAKMGFYYLTESGLASEVVAQTIAIIFAFITNKLWVFKGGGGKSVAREFVQFAASRLLLLGISALFNWYLIDLHPSLLMDLLSVDGPEAVLILTLFLQVLTIVLNYLASKFFVFREKKE